MPIRRRATALSRSRLDPRPAPTVPFGEPRRARRPRSSRPIAGFEQLLGDEELRELIRFLDQVDRLKFAPELIRWEQEVLADVLTSWEPRVETLRARYPAPGHGAEEVPGRTAPPTKSSGLEPRSVMRGEAALPGDSPLVVGGGSDRVQVADFIPGEGTPIMSVR